MCKLQRILQSGTQDQRDFTFLAAREFPHRPFSETRPIFSGVEGLLLKKRDFRRHLEGRCGCATADLSAWLEDVSADVAASSLTSGRRQNLKEDRFMSERSLCRFLEHERGFHETLSHKPLASLGAEISTAAGNIDILLAEASSVTLEASAHLGQNFVVEVQLGNADADHLHRLSRYTAALQEEFPQAICTPVMAAERFSPDIVATMMTLFKGQGLIPVKIISIVVGDRQIVATTRLDLPPASAARRP